MFRSLFFAIGIFLLIFGAQTLVVDKWIMSYESTPGTASVAQDNSLNRPFRTAGYNRSNGRFGTTGYNSSYYNNQPLPSNTLKPVYQTKEWMPWSLLAAGTVIVLYSVSTGRQGGE